MASNQEAVKAGYKQTEVGVIPEDWSVAPIGKLLIITTGNKNTQDNIADGQYPFFVRSQTIERINSYSFDCEAVLTAGDGVGTGKIFHYINGKFDVHQRVYVMHSFSEKLSAKYFYTCFSQFFYRRISSLTAKSSVDSVRKEMIADMLIALPPLAEQVAIAQAISDTDARITTLNALIRKKEQIKQGAMQQLLTGKVRLQGFGDGVGVKQTKLGELPEDWEVMPLSSVLSVQHGKSQHEVVVNDGKYPILATGGEIGRTNTPLYSKPSVLIGRKGTIDKPQFMDTPFWTVDTLFYTSIFSSADPKFIFYKFQLIDWYSHNEASGVPSLSSKTIEGILQVFPKDKAEQSAIAETLSVIDENIQTLKQRLAKTKALKQGMMQELLTGKTRLVPAAALAEESTSE